MSEVMTFSYKGYKFEKHERANTVHVYDEETNREMYIYTNHEIKDNCEKFRESCIETYNNEDLR